MMTSIGLAVVQITARARATVKETAWSSTMFRVVLENVARCEGLEHLGQRDVLGNHLLSRVLGHTNLPGRNVVPHAADDRIPSVVRRLLWVSNHS